MSKAASAAAAATDYPLTKSVSHEGELGNRINLPNSSSIMNNVATYSGNENNNPNQQVIIKKKQLLDTLLLKVKP